MDNQPIDVDNMPAGRELDALIATVVMEYKHVGTYWLVHRKVGDRSSYEDWRAQWQRDHPRQWPASEDIREFPDTTELRYWGVGEDVRVPDFSTEIDAAWQVVEHLISLHPRWRIVLDRSAHLPEEDIDPDWRVHIQNYELVPSDSYFVYVDDCDTAPLALCRAAYKAVQERGE